MGARQRMSSGEQDRHWLARVIVTLKPVVNDPQGLAVTVGLHNLGYAGVESTRVGKYLEVRLAAPDEAAARAQVDEMCRRLLTNPVIEQYRFELAAPAPA